MLNRFCGTALVGLAVAIFSVAGFAQSDRCANAGTAVFEKPLTGPHWTGWGVNTAQQRFQPADMAKLTAAQVPRLKLKWAFGFPDAMQAHGQPAIAGGRVFVGSAAKKVYSLDAKSGCIYWSFDTEAGVRTAITIGPHGNGWAVYFGDGRANAYALDALTGKLLWKTHLDDHFVATITGAPTLADGRLYVPVSSGEEIMGLAIPKYECCKFRGSVSALDAATGKVIWKSYTIPEEPKPIRKNAQGTQLWGPAGAGVWSSPTVDLKRKVVYVTTGDGYSDPVAKTSDAFIAFNLENGKLMWSRQLTEGDAYTVDCDLPEPLRTTCPEAKGPDFDFGSSAILVELPNGRSALIAGQKSGIVHALDPDREGEILWQKRVGKGSKLGGVQWGVAADARNVYVAVSDVEPTLAAPATPGAQAASGQMFLLDPKAGGGLYALRIDTGDTVWHTPHPGCGTKPGCSPAQSAAVTALPGLVLSGGLDGHMRAYSSSDGKIIWDVDTQQDYTTVNGVKAKGGSIDGPGAVVVDGMLYVTSGYSLVGQTPGNVLLGFSVDGK